MCVCLQLVTEALWSQYPPEEMSEEECMVWQQQEDNTAWEQQALKVGTCPTPMATGLVTACIHLPCSDGKFVVREYVICGYESVYSDGIFAQKGWKIRKYEHFAVQIRKVWVELYEHF